MTSDPIPSCDIQTCLRGLCILHLISGVTELIALETESFFYSKQRRVGVGVGWGGGGGVIIAIVKGVTILPNICLENTVRNRDSDPN